jgi:hypothetical protein
MGMYNETLDLERFTARIFLPLHIQLKTLYRQNMSIYSQNMKLKEEFHPFKNDLSLRNLNVLLKVAIEINEPLVEKNAPAKERDVFMTEGKSPAKRRSTRLRK